MESQNPRMVFARKSKLEKYFGEAKYAKTQTVASNGDGGDRTPDIVLAKHALSQLSYIPKSSGCERTGRTWIRTKDLSFIRAAL
jgi:hypothetical protein